MIKDALTSFSRVYPKKITDDLVELYYKTLKKYSEEQFLEAGYQCLEDAEKFPTPNMIISRMKKDYRGNGIRSERRQCDECGNVKYCIQEPSSKKWICRQCYSGLSIEETRARFQALEELMEKGFPEYLTTKEQRVDYMKERAKEIMGTGKIAP